MITHQLIQDLQDYSCKPDKPPGCLPLTGPQPTKTLGEKLRIFIPTVRELNISDRSHFQEDKNTNVAAAQAGKTPRGEGRFMQRSAEFWLKSVAVNLCPSFDILTF